MWTSAFIPTGNVRRIKKHGVMVLLVLLQAQLDADVLVVSFVLGFKCSP